MSDEERSAYYKKVEMGRKKLFNILRTDNVEELKTVVGLVDDKYNPEGEGLLKKRLRRGKKLYPIEEAVKNNCVKCFDYMVSLDCLDLNEYDIFENAVKSNSHHFLNKLLTMDVDINKAVHWTYDEREYFNLNHLRRIAEHPNFNLDISTFYPLPPLEVYKFFFDECYEFNIAKFIACEAGSYQINVEKVEYLMSICKDVNEIVDMGGGFIGTSIAYACYNFYNNSLEKTIKYMLLNGADPTISARGGLNALEYYLTNTANYNYNKKIVKMLSSKGVDINLETVIPKVVKNYCTPAIRFLYDDLEEDDILYLLDVNCELSAFSDILEIFIEKFGPEILLHKDFARNTKIDTIRVFLVYFNKDALTYLINNGMDCTEPIKKYIDNNDRNCNNYKVYDELKEFIKKNITDLSVLNHPKIT